MSDREGFTAHLRQAAAQDERLKGQTPSVRSLASRASAPISRFRPLAIHLNPATASLSSHTTQGLSSSARRDGRCAVCFSRSCKLTSHQTYIETKALRRHDSTTSKKTSGQNQTYKSSYAFSIASLYQASPVHPKSVFQNVSLPIDLNSGQMQNLFRDWFIVQAPRHFTIPRPREISNEIIHAAFIAPALVDDLLCLSILSVSAASQKTADSPADNVLALTLLDRTMGRLRERVLAEGADITDNTITAAIYVWASALYLADKNSLQRHAESVRALVDTRDDLSTLGMSGAVVTLFKWIDILNSLQLNSACQFPDDRGLRAPRLTARRYGSAWIDDKDSERDVGDGAISTACRNCCRLIELLEDEVKTGIHPANYWYIFERTSQLYQETSKLRHKYRNTGGPSECVVLAIDIVKLIVFNGGQTPSGRKFLETQADFLVAAIRATSGPSFWQTRIEVFIWLMFIAHLARPPSDTRPWCKQVLTGALDFRFGVFKSGDIANWMTELRTVLIKFVWPALPPFDDLQALCNHVRS